MCDSCGNLIYVLFSQNLGKYKACKYNQGREEMKKKKKIEFTLLFSGRIVIATVLSSRQISGHFGGVADTMLLYTVPFVLLIDKLNKFICHSLSSHTLETTTYCV